MSVILTGLILWILILIYNVVYSFLPPQFQEARGVKIIAMVSAIIILVIGIKQALHDYHNYKFAFVSASDGKIIKRKNFPWDIKKSISSDGGTIYIIYDRYGDASEVSIKPSKNVKNETVNTMTGLGVQFKCSDKEIPDFKIEIKG